MSSKTNGTAGVAKAANDSSEGHHDLDDSLGFLVNVVARVMRSTLEERLKAHGITSTQWVVMQGIAETSMMKQTDLGRRVDLDNATITRQLDRLEAAGLLKRNPAEDDRRTQLISLTPRGRRLLPVLNVEANEVNAQALKGLTPARRARLLIDLARIRDNLLPNGLD